MLSTAILVHQLPWRARLKLPSKRGDGAFLTAAAQRLAEAPGVRSVRTSPYADSLLVEHTGDFGAISAFAKQHEIFEVQDPAEAGANGQVLGPLNAAAVGFTGMGFYQISQGRYFGNAVENLWNAYGAYTALDRPLLAAALVGFGIYRLTEGQLLGSAASLFFYAATARHLARTHDPEAVA